MHVSVHVFKSCCVCVCVVARCVHALSMTETVRVRLALLVNDLLEARFVTANSALHRASLRGDVTEMKKIVTMMLEGKDASHCTGSDQKCDHYTLTKKLKRFQIEVKDLDPRWSVDPRLGAGIAAAIGLGCILCLLLWCGLAAGRSVSPLQMELASTRMELAGTRKDLEELRAAVSKCELNNTQVLDAMRVDFVARKTEWDENARKGESKRDESAKLEVAHFLFEANQTIQKVRADIRAEILPRLEEIVSDVEREAKTSLAGYQKTLNASMARHEKILETAAQKTEDLGENVANLRDETEDLLVKVQEALEGWSNVTEQENKLSQKMVVHGQVIGAQKDTLEKLVSESQSMHSELDDLRAAVAQATNLVQHFVRAGGVYPVLALAAVVVSIGAGAWLWERAEEVHARREVAKKFEDHLVSLEPSHAGIGLLAARVTRLEQERGHFSVLPTFLNLTNTFYLCAFVVMLAFAWAIIAVIFNFAANIAGDPFRLLRMK